MSAVSVAQIESFKTYLISKRVAATTRETYVSDVERLRAWLNGRALTIDTLEEYLNHLLMQGKNPQTVGRTYAAIRKLVGFEARRGDEDAVKIGAVLATGYKLAPAVRDEDRKVRYSATRTDFEAGLKFLKEHGGSYGFDMVQDSAALTLLWYTGLRRTELLTLSIEQAQTLVQTGICSVIGKGGKRRFIALCKNGRPALVAWLEALDEVNQRHQAKGRPALTLVFDFSRQRLNRLLHKIGPCSAHSYRHGYRYRAQRVGVHDELIAALLGHGPVNGVTSEYGRPLEADLLAAAEKIQ